MAGGLLPHASSSYTSLDAELKWWFLQEAAAEEAVAVAAAAEQNKRARFSRSQPPPAPASLGRGGGGGAGIIQPDYSECATATFVSSTTRTWHNGRSSSAATTTRTFVLRSLPPPPPKASPLMLRPGLWTRLLPKSWLIEVASWLDVRGLQQAAQVCTTWRRGMVQTDRLWESAYISVWGRASANTASLVRVWTDRFSPPALPSSPPSSMIYNVAQQPSPSLRSWRPPLPLSVAAAATATALDEEIAVSERFHAGQAAFDRAPAVVVLCTPGPAADSPEATSEEEEKMTKWVCDEIAANNTVAKVLPPSQPLTSPIGSWHARCVARLHVESNWARGRCASFELQTFLCGNEVAAHGMERVLIHTNHNRLLVTDPHLHRQHLVKQVDGDIFVIGSNGSLMGIALAKNIHLVTETGELRQRIPCKSMGNNLSLRLNDRRIFLGYEGGISAWDLETGVSVWTSSARSAPRLELCGEMILGGNIDDGVAMIDPRISASAAAVVGEWKNITRNFSVCPQGIYMVGISETTNYCAELRDLRRPDLHPPVHVFTEHEQINGVAIDGQRIVLLPFFPARVPAKADVEITHIPFYTVSEPSKQLYQLSFPHTVTDFDTNSESNILLMPDFLVVSLADECAVRFFDFSAGRRRPL